MNARANDALGLIELASIARGYRLLDWMVKASPITVVEANLIEPGKFLILFGGDVAEVQVAFDVAIENAGDHLLDKLLLPFAHRALWPAIAGTVGTENIDCLGIVESRTVASAIAAADRSVKEAEVQLRGLRFTPGLGGKAYYVVSGEQHAVESSVKTGQTILVEAGQFVDAQVIPRAHDEFVSFVLRKAPFGGG